MEKGVPLLRPMAPGSLAPRKAAVATCQPSARKWADDLPPQDSALLQPVQPAMPQPQPAAAPVREEDELDMQLDQFFAEAEAEPDDDDIPDAVPSHQLPVPACVPLYADDEPRRRSRWWLWLLAIVAGAAAVVGGAYVRMHFGPLF